MADADVTALLFSPDLRRSGMGHRGPRCLPGVTFSLELLEEEEPTRNSPDTCCFLCRRPFQAASDVFMYRGDTPFCSEECRQEQIDLDLAREWEISYRRRRHQHAARLKQARRTGD